VNVEKMMHEDKKHECFRGLVGSTVLK